MELHKIIPLECGLLNVIIETPRHSQNKYAYDFNYNIFRLKKALPMGMAFPFDFGFVPNTKGQDGDPLDVLVIIDESAYPGCMVQCRILGVLEATQKEKNQKPIRNDRIIAVATTSILFADITDVKELNKNMVQEIEHFFINYNRDEGKEFTMLGWRKPAVAVKLIEQNLTR
jgi:inorganic pyrophosphatase